MYNNDNPDLPTLNAWKLMTPPPAQRFVFERNPYYYRIDEKGVQLPYLDRVIFTVVGDQPDPGQGGAGRVRPAAALPQHARLHLPARSSARARASRCCCGRRARARSSRFYPNLNAKDETWRKLIRDVRFRRALSLAIDREELNEVVYIGLAKPSDNTIMPRSALFKPEYATKWATYDPKTRQQAARRDRPRQARRRRHPPAARRPAGDHRGRARQRGDRGGRRADADRRPVEEDRHQAAVQAADAREFPPAHLLRRGDHDRLCRHHHRGADRRHQPQGVRADDAGRAAMAEMGHVRRDRKGKQGEKPATWRRPEAARAAAPMGALDRRCRRAARHGTRS